MSVGCAVQGQVEEIDYISTLSIRSSPWGILDGVFLGPWNPPPGWSTLSWCLFRQHVTKGPGWKLPTPVPMRCVLSMTVLGPPPKSTLVCSSRWRTTCFLEAFTEHLLCTRHSAKCWMISLNPRIYSKIQVIIGFPRWQSGKQSTCQFRRCRRPGFHPWVGKTPWVGNGNPLQYSRLANPMDRGGWQATVHGVSRVRHDWAPPPEHTDNNIIPVHQIKELRIEKLNNLLAVIQLDNMIYLSPELFNCRAQTFNHHYPETFSRVGDPASVPWTRIEGSFPDSPNLRNILPAYSLNTPWLWRVKPVLGSRGLQTFSVKSQGVNISGFAGHPDSHNRSALSV